MAAQSAYQRALDELLDQTQQSEPHREFGDLIRAARAAAPYDPGVAADLNEILSERSCVLSDQEPGWDFEPGRGTERLWFFAADAKAEYNDDYGWGDGDCQEFRVRACG